MKDTPDDIRAHCRPVLNYLIERRAVVVARILEVEAQIRRIERTLALPVAPNTSTAPQEPQD